MEQEKLSSRIKLVVSNDAEPDFVQEPAESGDGKSAEALVVDATTNGGAGVVQPEKNIQTTNVLDANKLLTEAPLEDFFKALESASADELQTLVRSMESPGTKSSPGRMPALGAKFLQKIMEVPPEPRNVFSVWRWWEGRRWFYNAVVCLTGLPFLAFEGCRYPQLGLFFFCWLVAAAFYAIAANVCYSLGAPAELIARSFWKKDHYGPVLLTLGLIFSVAVTIGLGILFLLFGTSWPSLQG